MPSTSLTYVVVGVFLLGAALFGISSSMLRPEHPKPEKPAAVPSWPSLIDEAIIEADAPLRLEMVERLALVHSAWSREILERARSEERDPQLLAGIDAGLK